MNRRGKSKDSGRRGQGAGREDDDEGDLDHNCKMMVESRKGEQ